jgi:cell division protein FtsB
MAKNGNKAKTERAVFIVSITVIVVCLVGITISSMWSLSEIRRETAKLEQEMIYWQARLEEVESAIKEATKDETIERIARERLGLVLPGETVYMPKDKEED